MLIVAILFVVNGIALSQIAVTSPNGGEDWEVGSSKDITWTSAGTSGFVRIEYSINNGSYWNEIVANTIDNGSYTWTVPDSVSTNCLIRVSDTDDDPTDVSDTVFNISPIPVISVVAPNGGEDWQVGSSENITWTSVGTSGFVRIDYSINNGTSWTNIITSTSDDGIHPWTIPDAPSVNCLIRISDADLDPTDESDAVFTISPIPFVDVVTPNGGEDWQVGSSENITWTSVGTSGFVRIDYSINNGTSWTNIITSTSDDGIHPWTIPDAPSVNCLIRISDADLDPTDESDAVFTISPIPFVDVVTPNGGEDWQVGSNENITWNSSGTSGFVRIEYSINNGMYWNEIVANTIDDGSHTWTVPDSVSTNCLIRVSDTDDDPTDASNAVFTISPIPVISVVTPNGGEDWQVGSNENITWTSVGTSGFVRIDYSINNGTSWTNIINSTSNDGIHPWIIPDAPSVNCLIRISDADLDPTDESDAVFTISPIPFINLTSPSGGEDFMVGSTQEIAWTSSGTMGTVIIGFSFNNGANWSYEYNVPDDGSYLWTVPDIPSDNCLVSVSDADWDPFDEIDAVFSISSIPAIFLASPNGGEDWHVSDTMEITWNSVETSGNVQIEYSTNNGASWTEIVANTPDNGTYPWIIPDELSESCLIKISDVDGDPQGMSEAVFTISPVPYIYLTSPTGGEDFMVGSTQEIAWTSSGTMGTVIIGFSFNNGANWSYEDNIPDDGSYLWTVPDNPSDNCLVSVSDADWDPFDEIDAVFSISSIPAIFLTSPNGGEDWHVSDTMEITWNSVETSGNVQIEYSTNNGASWTEIVANTPDNGTYPWIIPDELSESCLIRISDVDGDPQGMSEAVFTISPVPYIHLTSPTGGEDFIVGSIQEIAWTSSGTMGTVIMGFSFNNGANWSYEYNVPDDGSYLWTIPDIPSDNCLVSVSDADWDPFDEIDAVFTISDTVTTAINYSTSGKIIVYPIPATNIVYLSFDKIQDRETIVKITDISGQVVSQGTISYVEGVLSINIEDLNNGMYLLEVISSGESQTFIIVKE